MKPPVVIDVTQLVARPATFRPIRHTRQQERDLYAIYNRVVRMWQDGLPRIEAEYSRTFATFTGDSPADIEVAIEQTEDNSIWATIRVLLAEWANSTMRWHLDKIGQNLTYVTNVELNTQLLGPATETIEDFLARNVALVRNVSDQTRGRIADIVFRGLQQQTPVREIAKQLNEAVGLGRKRSLRIAADQSNKLTSALDRLRMQQLGIDKFVWQHSGKLHYRPEHKARDGKVYAFGELQDMPGDLPFCGCVARAYVEPSG